MSQNAVSSRDPSGAASVVRRAALALAGWRGRFRAHLITGAAILLPLATFVSGFFWIKARGANEAIAQLAAGRDLAVDEGAAPQLVAARIAYLAQREEFDRARAFVESFDGRVPAALAAAARYNLGNAFLRKGFAALEKGDFDHSTPFIVLARREYRRALQLSPEFWDAKFNLDVASRLIRDFKEYERKEGDELPADPKKIWTDIPGAPKGLP